MFYGQVSFFVIDLFLILDLLLIVD